MSTSSLDSLTKRISMQLDQLGYLDPNMQATDHAHKIVAIDRMFQQIGITIKSAIYSQ